jgi:hypothetical protein
VIIQYSVWILCCTACVLWWCAQCLVYYCTGQGLINKAWIKKKCFQKLANICNKTEVFERNPSQCEVTTVPCGLATGWTRVLVAGCRRLTALAGMTVICATNFCVFSGLESYQRLLSACQRKCSVWICSKLYSYIKLCCRVLRHWKAWKGVGPSVYSISLGLKWRC